MSRQISRWVAIILVLLGASSYGLLSPLIKMAYADGWNEVQVSSSQVTMGTFVLWVMVLLNRKAWSNPLRAPWIRLSLVGVFGLALTTFFYNIALSTLDASLSIVMLFQFTWMTILMECLYSKRKPTKYQIAAVVLVMAGTLLAVNLSAANVGRMDMGGILFGLLSGFTYSLFLFFAGRIETTLHPSMKSALMLTAALPVIYFIYPPSEVFQAGTGDLLLWGLLLGVLGQVVPTVTFNIGIPRIGSSLAAMLASMELPVAVTAAFVMLGEQVRLIQWAGMALILLGIVISEKKPFG